MRHNLYSAAYYRGPAAKHSLTLSGAVQFYQFSTVSKKRQANINSSLVEQRLSNSSCTFQCEPQSKTRNKTNPESNSPNNILQNKRKSCAKTKICNLHLISPAHFSPLHRVPATSSIHEANRQVKCQHSYTPSIHNPFPPNRPTQNLAGCNYLHSTNHSPLRSPRILENHEQTAIP